MKEKEREDREERLVVLVAEGLKRSLRESAWRRRMNVSELVRAILEAFVAADSEAGK